MKKLISTLYILFYVTLFILVIPTSVVAFQQIAKKDNQNTVDTPGIISKFKQEYILEVKGTCISIFTRGKKIHSNCSIIRGDLENELCIADGFQQIVVKNNYFTIEQQTCGGSMFTKEYITFKYNERTKMFSLHKFGLDFIDKNEPERKIPEQVFTGEEFGCIDFEKVTLKILYALISR